MDSFMDCSALNCDIWHGFTWAKPLVVSQGQILNN